MDMFDPVDISKQIPAGFFTQIESKKWADRKEALETIEKITSLPKIANAPDIAELIRALKKIVSKDSNIVVSTLAAKCLCQLAQGLGTDFLPYATSSLQILFEKFKEKKPNVITVIRDATDAAFVGTNLEGVSEEVIKFLDNKNPQIRSEMALFLCRIFSRFPAQVMNKKVLKQLLGSLMKTLSDMDATVRDNSAMAIGTAMKVIGENLMMPLIADVEPIKITKIKDFCQKAEIHQETNDQNGHVAAPCVENGHTIVATNGVVDDEADDDNSVYDMLDAIDISNQVPSSFFTQIESKKWGERKEALEAIEKITSVPKIANADFSELIRVLKKVVGKDSNIVVATSAAKCLCQLAQGLRTNFSPHATSSLQILFEKYKEKKPNVNSVIRDATDAAFVGTNLEETCEDIIKFLDNKNPQIRSEMALFLSRVFAKFPAQVMNKKVLKQLLASLMKTLSDMDATVRDNSAMAIGTAMKVIGENLMMPLLADVEPIKITKIKEFCEKAEVKKIPASALAAAVQPLPAPAVNNPVPPPTRSSSATMIRSSSKKPQSRSGLKPPVSSIPGSNATVKRTATIIKRSTVPKRGPTGSNATQPPVAQNLPVPQQPAPTQAPIPQLNNMAPPQQLQQPTQPSTPVMPVYSTTMQAPRFAPAVSKPNDNFDMIIFGLISDNHDEVMDSLSELEMTLTDNTEAQFKKRINQIIDLSCLQLIKSIYSQRTAEKEAPKIRRVSECLVKIFARKQLAMAASQHSIRFLLVQIFTLTQSIDETEDEIVECLHNLSSAIMDSFEPTTMMCVLTGLLNQPPPSSIVEPIKNAIIRSMRSFK